MHPVIVAGGGPTGLALALCLARHEVPSVVLDDTAGAPEQRPARTVALRADTAAFATGIAGAPLAGAGARWGAWRTLRRRQELRRIEFGSEDPGPLHLAQHTLCAALRAAAAGHPLVTLAAPCRVTGMEQDPAGVTVHTRAPADGPGSRGGTARDGARDAGGPGRAGGTGVAGDAGGAGGAPGTLRGSHLVGCDGARSTVRKLLDVRFPGRTAVERYAVAALQARLPWPDEAVLHRSPPWRSAGPEVTARPLGDDVWRLDWLLPPRGELVTPEALLARVQETLAGWNDGTTGPYELLDTGVHTIHHRLARRWRVGRVFLAGDAAHLLGALGTQGVDENLRDVANLSWKLAHAWHHGDHDALLDSYQAERRAAVAARLRAADQVLPVLRGGGGVRRLVSGAGRGHETLLTDAHLGRGTLGGPRTTTARPLVPAPTGAEVRTGTAVGEQVADVPVTAEDGSVVTLRERLWRGRLVVVLVAPGTGVWARKHWMSAGVMPRLVAAVDALPHAAELLVAEGYPGAAAHTVLLVRPDGHLVTALGGIHPEALSAAAGTALGDAASSRMPAASADGAPVGGAGGSRRGDDGTEEADGARTG